MAEVTAAPKVLPESNILAGRTFAWLGRCRRLSLDREKSVRSSEAYVKLAMIHLMARRLRPSYADPAFQYHNAA